MSISACQALRRLALAGEENLVALVELKAATCCAELLYHSDAGVQKAATLALFALLTQEGHREAVHRVREASPATDPLRRIVAQLSSTDVDLQTAASGCIAELSLRAATAEEVIREARGAMGAARALLNCARSRHLPLVVQACRALHHVSRTPRSLDTLARRGIISCMLSLQGVSLPPSESAATAPSIAVIASAARAASLRGAAAFGHAAATAPAAAAAAAAAAADKEEEEEEEAKSKVVEGGEGEEDGEAAEGGYQPPAESGDILLHSNSALYLMSHLGGGGAKKLMCRQLGRAIGRDNPDIHLMRWLPLLAHERRDVRGVIADTIASLAVIEEGQSLIGRIPHVYDLLPALVTEEPTCISGLRALKKLLHSRDNRAHVKRHECVLESIVAVLAGPRDCNRLSKALGTLYWTMKNNEDVQEWLAERGHFRLVVQLCGGEVGDGLLDARIAAVMETVLEVDDFLAELLEALRADGDDGQPCMEMFFAYVRRLVTGKKDELQSVIASVLSALAKSDELCKPFVDAGMTPVLVFMIMQTSLPDVQSSVFRALGYLVRADGNFVPLMTEFFEQLDSDDEGEPSESWATEALETLQDDNVQAAISEFLQSICLFLDREMERSRAAHADEAIQLEDSPAKRRWRNAFRIIQRMLQLQEAEGDEAAEAAGEPGTAVHAAAKRAVMNRDVLLMYKQQVPRIRKLLRKEAKEAMLRGTSTSAGFFQTVMEIKTKYRVQLVIGNLRALYFFVKLPRTTIAQHALWSTLAGVTETASMHEFFRRPAILSFLIRLCAKTVDPHPTAPLLGLFARLASNPWARADLVSQGCIPAMMHLAGKVAAERKKKWAVRYTHDTVMFLAEMTCHDEYLELVADAGGLRCLGKALADNRFRSTTLLAAQVLERLVWHIDLARHGSQLALCGVAALSQCLRSTSWNFTSGLETVLVYNWDVQRQVLFGHMPPKLRGVLPSSEMEGLFETRLKSQQKDQRPVQRVSDLINCADAYLDSAKRAWKGLDDMNLNDDFMDLMRLVAYKANEKMIVHGMLSMVVEAFMQGAPATELAARPSLVADVSRFCRNVEDLLFILIKCSNDFDERDMKALIRDLNELLKQACVGSKGFHVRALRQYVLAAIEAVTAFVNRVNLEYPDSDGISFDSKCVQRLKKLRRDYMERFVAPFSLAYTSDNKMLFRRLYVSVDRLAKKLLSWTTLDDSLAGWPYVSLLTLGDQLSRTYNVQLGISNALWHCIVRPLRRVRLYYVFYRIIHSSTKAAPALAVMTSEALMRRRAAASSSDELADEVAPLDSIVVDGGDEGVEEEKKEEEKTDAGEGEEAADAGKEDGEEESKEESKEESEEGGKGKAGDDEKDKEESKEEDKKEDAAGEEDKKEEEAAEGEKKEGGEADGAKKDGGETDGGETELDEAFDAALHAFEDELDDEEDADSSDEDNTTTLVTTEIHGVREAEEARSETSASTSRFRNLWGRKTPVSETEPLLDLELSPSMAEKAMSDRFKLGEELLTVERALRVVEKADALLEEMPLDPLGEERIMEKLYQDFERLPWFIKRDGCLSFVITAICVIFTTVLLVRAELMWDMMMTEPKGSFESRSKYRRYVVWTQSEQTVRELFYFWLPTRGHLGIRFWSTRSYFVIAIALPIILTKAVLPALDTDVRETVMSIFVPAYIAIWFLLVTLSIVRLVRDRHNRFIAMADQIHWRPFREYYANYLALLFLVVELLQMMAVSFIRKVPWGSEYFMVKVTGPLVLEFIGYGAELPHDTRLWVAFILMAIWAWIAKASGKFKKHPRINILVTYVVPFIISSFAFMGIMLTIFQTVDCIAVDRLPRRVMNSNHTVVCWEGQHLEWTTLALIGIGMFLPLATLYPGMSQVLFPQEKIDIVFAPYSILLAQLMRALIVLFTTFFYYSPYAFLSINVAGNLLLLGFNVWRRPASIWILNVVKLCIYGFGAFTAAVAMWRYGTNVRDPNEVFLLLHIGWGAILVLGLLLTRTKFMRRAHAHVDEEDLEDEEVWDISAVLDGTGPGVPSLKLAAEKGLSSRHLSEDEDEDDEAASSMASMSMGGDDAFIKNLFRRAGKRAYSRRDAIKPTAVAPMAMIEKLAEPSALVSTRSRRRKKPAVVWAEEGRADGGGAADDAADGGDDDDDGDVLDDDDGASPWLG
eukprot:PLAT2538.8.p1 GENE.PLAT2538.8~~PLAT2538.8.p1  ORF type:complete len:2295 (-),score=1059.05 PLAT2538.8:364-6831(-)